MSDMSELAYPKTATMRPFFRQPHALIERGGALYETPRCATEALCALMRVKDHTIWEPCAGRGTIAHVLEAHGARVYMSDLNSYPGADVRIHCGVDFLLERAVPPLCDLIITNPPFELATKMVRHGLMLGCEIIILQRLQYLSSLNRLHLFNSHCTDVFAFADRLPDMHREGWQGKKH